VEGVVADLQVARLTWGSIEEFGEIAKRFTPPD
jgi:hypothetical protein